MDFNLSSTSIVLGLLIVTIWLVVGLKRFRHKIFAVFLILIILFTYLNFVPVVAEKNLDLTTFEGVKAIGTIYFSWLGSIFANIRTLTANAIRLDWSPNEVEIKENS